MEAPPELFAITKRIFIRNYSNLYGIKCLFFYFSTNLLKYFKYICMIFTCQTDVVRTKSWPGGWTSVTTPEQKIWCKLFFGHFGKNVL